MQLVFGNNYLHKDPVKWIYNLPTNTQK